MSATWSLELGGSPTAQAWECIAAAIAAPSVHNSQPWRFRVTPNHIEVYADRSRQLQVVDPGGRELAMSVGAAILNLRVAILARGRLPMHHLLPDPDQPDLLAVVAAGPALKPTFVSRRLAWAIPRRHSSRQPFLPTDVPEQILEQLRAAAQVENADLFLADPALRDAVLSLARTAENLRHADPDYLVELAAWTKPAPGRLDGVPGYAYAGADPDRVVPLRDFGVAFPGPPVQPRRFEDAPLIGVLYTAGDTVLNWLHAGQALQRALLTATVHGLQSTLMTQPLEYPQLRALFDDSAQGRVAQAIVRFGYGPAGSPSPRRPVSDVMINGRRTA